MAYLRDPFPWVLFERFCRIIKENWQILSQKSFCEQTRVICKVTVFEEVCCFCQILNIPVVGMQVIMLTAGSYTE